MSRRAAPGLGADAIDPEAPAIRLTAAQHDVFQAAARQRGLSTVALVRAVLNAVARDGLIDAVLDDGGGDPAAGRTR